jgi:peroxiredoxin (alkyl hydroperoxide reductase subunit C)
MARIATAMPRLNERAPEFEAPSTHGIRKLSDYEGKWLVLFSPRRTSPRFAPPSSSPSPGPMSSSRRSIASCWERNIKEKFGVEIRFPIIADLSMQVARA